VLATTLWYVVALALLAGLGLETAAAFARAGVHAAADHALEPALHDAIADYQNRLSSAIATQSAPLAPPVPFTGAPPSLAGYASALATLPNPLQQTIAADPNGEPFTIAYVVTPTTLASPSCDPAAPSSGSDAVGRLQCGGFVQESRVSLHVRVTVSDAAGTTALAQRDAYVTLRLFAVAPYSAIAGRKDGAAADPLESGTAAHEGDIGGASAATVIHLRYACSDGAGTCANAAPPDPDAALQSGVPWTNGNAP
jgi:hypothetical protein